MLIRLLDIVLSAIALLILSPLMIVVALVLRFTGEGEVVYRQTRVGRDGRPFGLLKFATMLKNSPDIGAGLLTLRDDPRVLPVGRFLRATKLNELPQLLNVLSGDMSLIGPRPQARPHFDVFPDRRKPLLTSVRPGLSGIGSIVFRDEESLLEHASDKAMFYADVIAPYKADLECWYIERRSAALYVGLILLTIWVVLVPASRLPYRVFGSLPTPPEMLK